MNLGQFHSRISAALRKGNALDDLIPGWVAEAANLVETQNTFQWMRKVVTVPVDLTAEEPNQLTMPARCKNVEWLRVSVLSEDGRWQFFDPLQGVDALAISSIDKCMPSAFWLDGLDFIYLDAVPDPGTNYPFSLQLKYAEYTDWPGDDNATPSLLGRGQSLLASETLLLASQETRDPRLTDVYSARRDRALQALIGSDAEMDFRHQGNKRLNYVIPG